MPDAVLYHVDSVSTGEGRAGHVSTSDGRIDMDMTFPKEMGGTGQGANPEEFFAVAWSACFHSALRTVARKANADVDGSTVTARVSIGPDGSSLGLGVTMMVHMPHVPPQAAQQFAEQAHKLCPYSKATHGNIPVHTEIV